MSYQILLILHVAFMAGWFGFIHGSSPTVRRANKRGDEHLAAAVAEARRRSTFSIGAGVLTVVTGFGLVFVRFDGFVMLPHRLYLGMGLAIAMLAITSRGTRPTLALLKNSARVPDDPNRRRLLLRLIMLDGLLELLWLTVLVIMLWRV